LFIDWIAKKINEDPSELNLNKDINNIYEKNLYVESLVTESDPILYIK
jgi:hypothetical protein